MEQKAWADKFDKTKAYKAIQESLPGNYKGEIYWNSR